MSMPPGLTAKPVKSVTVITAMRLNLANVQNQDITVKQWEYVRGKDPHSSLTTTTLDGLYSTITGSMGIISSRIQSSQAFAEIMVNNLTEQRDAISAVSLDEEMIRMMPVPARIFSSLKVIVGVG